MNLFSKIWNIFGRFPSLKIFKNIYLTNSMKKLLCKLNNVIGSYFISALDSVMKEISAVFLLSEMCVKQKR